MAEEPNQEGKGAWKRHTFLSEVKEFFFENPTLVVTMLYAYITAIGIVYSWALYRMFGINIFDYSEIADFLLAAFKNTFALLSIVLVAAMGAAVESFMANRARRDAELIQSYLEDYKRAQAQLDHLQPESEESNTTAEQRAAELRAQIATIQAEFDAERARPFLRRLFGLRPRPTPTSQGRRRGIATIIISLTIVFSSLLLPYYSAGGTASSIKEGKTPLVDVRYRSFSGSAGQVTEPGLQLIGATQKAAFFYDVDGNRTIVIPQAQIVSIEVPD